jgi:sugar lactone lactonase YvrE
VNRPGSAPGEERRPVIVAVVLPDGTTRQVADDVWFPNGMAVLGDDTLVVAESHADRLTAWTMTDSGELVDRRVWADLGPGSLLTGSAPTRRGRSGTPASPGSVARGSRLAARCSTVEADRGCFACMLGGDDGRTLFIVANQWSGSGASDGIVLVQPVAVPHDGRP